eukprot:TRINITY_DN7277_c0_g3_i6.p1 TRINITY_DN7277_c0_g3~~TRINITY_DN7277_c0_g3_i6.p1  ORF type:complete len:429 (+),score=128.28 TRINITY_DN7277_c0_g3_i6:272-1558(+)
MNTSHPISIPQINLNPLTGWDIGPKYKFLKLLGCGSYGSVCLALNTKTETYSAIKKFAGIFEDPVKCKRVLREIELLHSVHSPHIVKPLDVFMRQGADIYLVMEIGQVDLLALRRSVYLVEKQVKAIMYRLLTALNHLHSGGIIHRDVKPANILINHDCSIKLCDFSLSRSISGLNSSCFDCSLILRRYPSLKLPEDSDDDVVCEEVDEGEKTTPKTVHCEFQVNFEKTRTQKEPEDSPDLREFIEEKKRDQRNILLNTSKVYSPTYERELSGHIATRWYRPPEIILLEKVYTTAVDMWSAGCVFAELLEMVKENQPVIANRSVLFPGKSCFPLSPSENPTAKVIGMPTSPQDQLRTILAVFGQPCLEDLSFLNDQRAEDYVKALSEVQARTELRHKLPAATEEAMDLLRKLLSFNPCLLYTSDAADE